MNMSTKQQKKPFYEINLMVPKLALAKPCCSSEILRKAENHKTVQQLGHRTKKS